jgi:hypothetical protein
MSTKTAEEKIYIHWVTCSPKNWSMSFRWKALRVLLELGCVVQLLFEEITLDGLLGEGRLDAGYTLGC